MKTERPPPITIYRGVLQGAKICLVQGLCTAQCKPKERQPSLPLGEGGAQGAGDRVLYWESHLEVVCAKIPHSLSSLPPPPTITPRTLSERERGRAFKQGPHSPIRQFKGVKYFRNSLYADRGLMGGGHTKERQVNDF